MAQLRRTCSARSPLGRLDQAPGSRTCTRVFELGTSDSWMNLFSAWSDLISRIGKDLSFRDTRLVHLITTLKRS